ncbi:MAG: preprotein translocase subunit YajC [Candidatus Didemnitutus sp.]|nr:preprotein translocase subunit YajC [Candidatus Didemnitutus sp.]
MTKLSLFLAQAQPAAPTGMQTLMSLLPMILIFAAMYFLLIAPQRKKQKQHEQMLGALKTGDDIVTTGGIYGTITGVKEDRFIVRVGDNNQKLEIGKSFVHGLIKKDGV